MFRITLRDARILNGYTVEEAAEYCGVSVYALDKLETDSERMQLSLVSKILTLYGVSSSLIYFGTEADCIEYNRNRITLG